MPYIDASMKADLKSFRLSIGRAGELTYLLQQELLEYIQARGLSYQTIAECLGALEGAKADLIERVVKPYEERKRHINGDVWPEELTNS
jgi:hypothetical protein